MSVTTQFVDVETLGGPYDGESVRVQVGPDGLPPAFYTFNDLGALDYRVDPGHRPAQQIAAQYYARDMVIAGDDMKLVYVWQGESLPNAA